VQAEGNGTLLLDGANLPHSRGMIVPLRPTRKLDSSAICNVQVIDVNAGSPVLAALSLIKTDFDYETADGIAERLMPFPDRWLKPLLVDLPNAQRRIYH
jgi:hypothetical protein